MPRASALSQAPGIKFQETMSSSQLIGGVISGEVSTISFVVAPGVWVKVEKSLSAMKPVRGRLAAGLVAQPENKKTGSAKIKASRNRRTHGCRESQRDSGTKPRVASCELPWENGPQSSQPQRGCVA